MSPTTAPGGHGLRSTLPALEPSQGLEAVLFATAQETAALSDVLRCRAVFSHN